MCTDIFLCSQMYILFISCLLSTDQCRSSYQVGFDNSLRITYANGMDTHYQTEPHILAGAANPTVARRNMSLPGESGQNLVEWRFRKEQARGKVIVFGRKLRVCLIPFYLFFFLPCSTCKWSTAQKWIYPVAFFTSVRERLCGGDMWSIADGYLCKKNKIKLSK